MDVYSKYAVATIELSQGIEPRPIAHGLAASGNVIRGGAIALTLLAAAAANFAGPASAFAAAGVGLPNVSGSYMRARPKLLRLGYTPMTLKRDGRSIGELCSSWRANSDCSGLKLPEGYCAADIPACNFFWRTASGRVIEIRTEGESRLLIGQVQWAEPHEASELRGLSVKRRR